VGLNRDWVSNPQNSADEYDDGPSRLHPGEHAAQHDSEQLRPGWQRNGPS